MIYIPAVPSCLIHAVSCLLQLHSLFLECPKNLILFFFFKAQLYLPEPSSVFISSIKSNSLASPWIKIIIYTASMPCASVCYYKCWLHYLSFWLHVKLAPIRLGPSSGWWLTKNLAHDTHSIRVHWSEHRRLSPNLVVTSKTSKHLESQNEV